MFGIICGAARFGFRVLFFALRIIFRMIAGIIRAVMSIGKRRENSSAPRTAAGRPVSQMPADSVPRPASAAPVRTESASRNAAEYDGNLRTFTLQNPEGELYSVNTADINSRFYGPVWTRILAAHESGEFIRGTAVRRMMSRDNRLSGYLVDISGVEAFMPISQSAWFYHPQNDPTGKLTALSVETIHISGARAGSIVVSAWKPLKSILSGQGSRAFAVGSSPYALAMDFDGSSLIFPLYGDASISVPLNDAFRTALARGLEPKPNMLTGHFWRLRIESRNGKSCRAVPLDVIAD